MGYRYSHLMKLTPNQLHNHCERLKKKGMNPLEVDAIRNTVLENKAHRKSQRAHGIQLRNQWRVIMSALMAEKKSVRSLLLYKNSKSHEERKVALEGYMAVIEKVESKFKELMQTGVTPDIMFGAASAAAAGVTQARRSVSVAARQVSRTRDAGPP